jgi:hypothetical protein
VTCPRNNKERLVGNPTPGSDYLKEFFAEIKPNKIKKSLRKPVFVYQKIK